MTAKGSTGPHDPQVAAAKIKAMLPKFRELQAHADKLLRYYVSVYGPTKGRRRFDEERLKLKM